MLPPPANCAFLFPGQGSQSVGMGSALAEAYPVARETFEHADKLLDFSLSRLAWEGPEEELNDTVNTQPALMVHSVAALRVFQEKFPGYLPAFVAGHSMGELSALVAAGALEYSPALHLVRRRGELMKAAGEISAGGMAAILGLDIETTDQVCAEASTETEKVQIANDNCPGQVVISGADPAVERAVELARQAGARRAVPLAVSIAAHSPLMEDAQKEFTEAVLAAPMREPLIPVIANVSATPITTVAQIRADLAAQLNSRVRWKESVQYMIANGVTTFFEIGSGSVLSGLFKRIDRQVQGIPLGYPEDFEKISL